MPRLATFGRPVAGELGSLGASANVGDAAATSATVGAGGQRDVESDFRCVGILEQRHLDADLIRYPGSTP
jgi:hypothetical protein